MNAGHQKTAVGSNLRLRRRTRRSLVDVRGLGDDLNPRQIRRSRTIKRLCDHPTGDGGPRQRLHAQPLDIPIDNRDCESSKGAFCRSVDASSVGLHDVLPRSHVLKLKDAIRAPSRTLRTPESRALDTNWRLSACPPAPEASKTWPATRNVDARDSETSMPTTSEGPT